MKIRKAKKKPVVINFIEWEGNLSKEICDYFMDWKNISHDKFTGLIIHPLEGNMEASVGDYIIKDIHRGEIMTKLNRNTKTQVAEAIQQLYIVSTAINLAVGNEIHQDYFENQRNLTLSEINETEEAIKKGDLVEVLDGIGDMLVTGSFVNIIVDGNDDLTKNAPLYLNESVTSLEELFSSAKVSFNSGNYIDFLESVEDMAYQVNGDFVEYASAINKSNLSKFPEAGTIDPEVEADLIEQQGRYPDVYFEETDLLGKRVYVFKSKYDAKNDESFPKGKYLKPPTVFKEPQDFL